MGAVIEVAEGVLNIEKFNPMLRTAAYRLLGQAHWALSQSAAACAAAERAVAEAATAGYVWLEMLSLRDLHRYSSEAAAEEVDSISLRLDAVYRRMSASRKDAEATIRKFRRFEEANEVWVGRELSQELEYRKRIERGYSGGI